MVLEPPESPETHRWTPGPPHMTLLHLGNTLVSVLGRVWRSGHRAVGARWLHSITSLSTGKTWGQELPAGLLGTLRWENHSAPACGRGASCAFLPVSSLMLPLSSLNFLLSGTEVCPCREAALGLAGTALCLPLGPWQSLVGTGHTSEPCSQAWMCTHALQMLF